MTSEEFSQRIVDMMQTLYRVSYSQLSQGCDREDAVQECICKAWKKRHYLRDESVMQTWVIRILINECRNIQKKKGRELPLDELSDIPMPQTSNHELHDAILNLDEKLRLPILLYYIEGYSTKEIAQILCLPHGTVKSRLSRGRQNLQKTIVLGEVIEP